MQWRVGSSGVVKNDEPRAMLASPKGISEMYVASFMIWFKLKMRPSWLSSFSARRYLLATVTRMFVMPRTYQQP